MKYTIAESSFENKKDIAKNLKETDPIIRNADKGDVNELSPMDPPDAYDKKFASDITYDDLHKNLQELFNEHINVIAYCDDFEKAINEFKQKGFYISKETNRSFNAFFVFFDEEVLPHNRKEERGLFPILKKRMLENGEHSEGENPHTPVDLMEEDHVKLIQLATLTFNFLGLAMRLKDNESRAVVFDIAYNKALELIELLRLHIYREDHTIFPLAQKYLSPQELEDFA